MLKACWTRIEEARNPGFNRERGAVNIGTMPTSRHACFALCPWIKAGAGRIRGAPLLAQTHVVISFFSAGKVRQCRHMLPKTSYL